MSVRPHPRKTGWWIVDTGYGPSRRKIPYEGTRAEAIEFEASLQRRKKSTRTTNPRLREITLEWFQSWSLDHVQGSGLATQNERMIRIENFFGSFNLNSITPVLIEKYKSDRLRSVKPATINKELSVLSQILKWALDRDMIEQLPRIKRFPPKLTTPAPPVIPAHSELLRVIEATPRETRGMYRLMLLYGLRSAEARHLRPSDVHQDRRLLSVTGKGNKTRIIPIVDDETWDMLRDRSNKATDGYLWWSKRSNGPYKSLRDGLKRAAKRVGVDGKMYCHLLRHAAATELVGVADVKTVGSLLGHTSSAVTDRYLHLRQDRLTTALEQVINSNAGHDMSQK